MHIAGKKKKKAGVIMRIGQLLSWLVAGSQSVILLNRGGGRVGEQSVSLWKQGYEDEDYHCQRASLS